MTETTTPQGIPTLRWLLEKLQAGEMTPQEFIKLSKERGVRFSETLMDTDKSNSRYIKP